MHTPNKCRNARLLHLRLTRSVSTTASTRFSRDQALRLRTGTARKMPNAFFSPAQLTTAAGLSTIPALLRLKMTSKSSSLEGDTDHDHIMLEHCRSSAYLSFCIPAHSYHYYLIFNILPLKYSTYLLVV